MKMSRKISHLIFLVLVFCFSIFLSCSNSLPLSTNKRWIMDDSTGKRMKLRCAHWVGHIEPMIPEGLAKQPLNDIATQVAKRGLNCIRLSYATYMVTRYANDSVGETLFQLDLPEAIAGIAKHNPSVLNMTHLEAYEAAVDALGSHGIMVIVDNHVSQPKWCCDPADGNGFFGDWHFQPEEWLQGLAFMANRFKGKHHVVAMDLRNELRGARQNDHDWYKYVTEGASTIHKLNPDLLVVISGLDFDKEFRFLKEKALNVDLGNKLVYETHLYSFSGPTGRWDAQPLNRVCALTIKDLNKQSGFLMGGDNPAPLFLSEFGYDMRGVNSADNKYIPCLVAYAASVDLDWSLWAFGGSYYIRQGNVGMEETYALLDGDWENLRDPKFPEKFQLMQRVVQDPSSKLAKADILFHPLSGECVHVNKDNQLELGDCKNPNRWTHEGDGTPLRILDSALCLKVAGEGLPPTLSEDCLSPQSSWKSVSQSGLHLATVNKMDESLCLQKDVNSKIIVTNKCICIEDDSACMANPQSQWFLLVTTNVE